MVAQSEHEFKLAMYRLEQEMLLKAREKAREAASLSLTPSQISKHARKISVVALNQLERILQQQFPGENFALLISLTNSRRENLFSIDFQNELRQLMSSTSPGIENPNEGAAAAHTPQN